MQPTFILTRAFAISALFVGAAPLAHAAPISHPNAAASCVSGISCTGAASSLWAFIAAFVPSTPSAPTTIFENLIPQGAAQLAVPVSEPPAAADETVVVVVVEVTCADGACESSLYKRDEVEFEAREPEAVEERDSDVDIIIRAPEPTAAPDSDVDIIIRDPSELEDREPAPEPDPMCFGIAYCKRESQ